jgi:glycyl-tRNA synthetase alpha chain
VRELARAVAEAYLASRRAAGFPLADATIREEVLAELAKQDAKQDKKGAK